MLLIIRPYRFFKLIGAYVVYTSELFDKIFTTNEFIEK